MARVQTRKVFKKKSRMENEETTSVTASVTSSGYSKEGMKGIIFGLSKEKGVLLEENKSLQKKVEKLEHESMMRKGGENVEANPFKKLKERPFNCTEDGCGKAFALRTDLVNTH